MRLLAALLLHLNFALEPSHKIGRVLQRIKPPAAANGGKIPRRQTVEPLEPGNVCGTELTESKLSRAAFREFNRLLRRHGTEFGLQIKAAQRSTVDLFEEIRRGAEDAGETFHLGEELIA